MIKKYLLKEICSRLSSGKAISSDMLSEEGIYPVYGGNGLRGYTSVKNFDGECAIIGRQGAYCGNVNFFSGEGYMTEHAVVVCGNEKVYTKYLYYLLTTMNLGRLSGQSAQPGLSVKVLGEQEVVLPNLNQQKKVADMLFALDAKIVKNNTINNNLQNQTKLLYDFWFNQFEFPNMEGKPYKSSGGKLVWNDELKRHIPENWSVISLSEILSKNTVSFDYSSVKPTIDLSVMPQNSISLSQCNESSNFTTNLYVMNKGDILFGSIRPYLKKAGFAPFDGVVAGTVHSFKVSSQELFNFALITLCRDSFFNYAIKMSAGTKMPVVSSDAILNYKVPFSYDIAKKFGAIDLLNIISNNIEEIQRLSTTRDYLLPLLMNGQAIVD